MSNSTHTESWVTFFRIKCKEGFIDRWMGDVADNPNNTKQSSQQLNSFATYYRLNGDGLWMSQREFKKSVAMESSLFKDMYSSDYIWHNCLEKSYGDIT